MSEDIEKKVVYDFYSSPIKKWQLILSYLLTSWYVGIFFGIINLIIGEAYIVLAGGNMLPLFNLFLAVLMVIFSVIFLSSISFFIMSYVRSSTAASTVNSIFGTFIGFLGGIYIPISVLGEGIQTFMKLVPYSYVATIFRKVYMVEPIKEVFKEAPIEAVNTYKNMYGFNMYIGNHNLSVIEMLLIITGIGILFYVLTLIKFKREKKLI